MIRVMHTYRKPILWAVVIIVVVSFVFATAYDRATSRSGPNEPGTGQPIAVVGSEVIMPTDFRNALTAESERQARGGARPSDADLYASGAADRVLRQLEQNALLSHKTRERGLAFDRAFLVEQLQQMSVFQFEEGGFDTARWNEWIEEIDMRGDTDWNRIYNSVGHDLGREVLRQLIMAPARVLESEVRDAFEQMHTKIRVKYVQVEPKIEVNAEQVQTQYDENISTYNIPEERKARFIAVSLVPDKPTLVDELINRARAGESFAELAKAHSEAGNKDDGGLLDWMVDAPTLSPHLKPVFALEAGEVSDAVAGPGNTYYFYQVDEKRKREGMEEDEVLARQIMIRATLDETQADERMARATLFSVQGKANGGLVEVAEGVELIETDFFSTTTPTIVGVDGRDIYLFRRDASTLAQGEISDVIEGLNNLYVAEITEIKPAVPQPLDTVRDKVRQDAIAAVRRSDDYAARVRDTATRIEVSANSILDIVTQFPELGAEAKETPAFDATEPLYSQGLFWNVAEVFALVGQSEPGTFAGPITDMMGGVFFIELVEKTPPDDTIWETQWPEEEERVRDALLMTRRAAHLQDYMAHALLEVPVQQDGVAIAQMLGLIEDAPPETATESPAADTPETANEEVSEEAAAATD